MADLVIEHDPDGNGGCRGVILSCPFLRLVTAAGSGINRFSSGCGAAANQRVGGPGTPAPQWCPLRTARVVVQRPGGES